MDKNYFAVTDTGKVRDHNEDTFIAEKTAGNDFILACVIDGVGGYSGGEIASAIARDSILQHLKNGNGELQFRMKAAVVAADQEIMKEKTKDKAHEKMACVLTLAVVDLHKNQFSYAHVGDTRLYLLRDNSLVKISKDQSFVGHMEDTGRLTEQQAMRHPKRNEINKALGFGAGLTLQEDYIDIGQSPFLPGDLLLICSDGLSDMVTKQEITEILTSAGSLQEKGTQLVNAANHNGGLDNITVVLVKNDKETTLHEIAKPAMKPLHKNPAIKPAGIPTVTTPNLTVPPLIQNQSAPVRNKERSKQTGVIGVLSILCFLFLASTAYLLWQNFKNDTDSLQELRSIKPPRNPQEKKLQDTLNNLTGNVLILTDSLFKSPILITEPLKINKDTLYIIAEKNITIKRDSSFREIPIVILPAGKHILLENFTFEDFNTVISTQNNSLTLKNVRFNNSPNAIQSTVSFPSGKYINGKIPLIKFKTDTLPSPVNN